MFRAKRIIVLLFLVLLCFLSFNFLLSASYPKASTQSTKPVSMPTSRPAKATPTSASAADSATEEETAYVLMVLGIVSGYADALDAMGVKLAQMESSPTLLINEDWTRETTSVFAAMLDLSRQLHEMRPPPRMADAHAKLLEGARHYDLAVTYADKSISNLDMDVLSLAATEIRLGGDSMSRGVASIAALQASLK